jgi:hypothetical protein
MVLFQGKQRYVGGIENVVHDAALVNGNIVGLGTKVSGEDQYNAVLPATASLAATEYLLVLQDPISYVAGADPEDYTIAIGTPFKAIHLEVGNKITLPVATLASAATVGEFLIPADGTAELTPAADLIGGTRLALEVLAIDVVLKVGSYRETDGVLARVITA